ncbi:hypothetical protein AGABI1DRAFT_113412 [Agaricus bisporus var. burnettii JB137-S8]|uniref:Uncharacterized protein n=1 Tax=Agaricus bisporus var. burnettii (strain JB137-S8 / ATCC MYA-4627 / FGSC 10392) TaxID=597362 RepID=K5WXJ7_AGABU|nr:uncharacterized protein AGABI1DRAFT_113412 [Agaricus bisporus var. burnettii JB137-S8]EKM80206.1 hypothetical protein AGABI1DRAFT_113412 [Agaricus bisporus var. burnettii JB137-S8]
MSSYARSPTGLRSPPPPRSAAASPRPKFDSESLRTYMKKLLLSTFQGTVWPDPKDQNDRIRTWNKEINERVKERMVELQSHGYKYVVLTQVTQNLGQGGRIDMVSHWDETDIVAKEIFYNDSLVCMCIALAIS